MKPEEMLNIVKESREAASGATIRTLEREVAVLKREYGKALEFNDGLLAAIAALPPVKVRPFPAPNKGSVVSVVANLSDWHIGERVDFEAMDGFNSYNFAIANARLALFIDKVLAWVDLQRSGYRISHLHVNVLGDLINGDIHPEEYWPTNEFAVPEQVAKAGAKLAEVVVALSAGFDTVTVEMIGADNHGRRTKKPASKVAAMNSHNYLIYELAAAILKTSPAYASTTTSP